ncbi:hypothetical protein FGG78_21325 [Thioclava sp. BHET1]|nr:hypothetical protein FGG78_21325 [Thioclava sp. BHET1]
MALLRPEVTAGLHRWREVIFAGGVALLGLWVLWQGGPLPLVVGLGLIALGLGLAITGWRRLRFAQAVSDPGIVRIVEGQIAYFGPEEGGAAGLSLITEIALQTHDARRCWRISQSDGSRLFIPTAAEGAEALFDAFTGLPGLEAPALLAAISGPPDMARIVWRRRSERSRLARS